MSIDLFTGDEVDERKEWEIEWKGMPKFNAAKNDDAEFACIMVRLKTKEDFADFCDKIGQDINLGKLQNRSIWHPKLNISTLSDFFV